MHSRNKAISVTIDDKLHQNLKDYALYMDRGVAPMVRVILTKVLHEMSQEQLNSYLSGTPSNVDKEYLGRLHKGNGDSTTLPIGIKMKTISSKELQEVLDNHKLWLKEDSKDGRADLRGVDLEGANLANADLRGVNLR